MAVIRVNKTKDYVVMSNYHFKEKNMSLKAKGLLSEMLSLPDDWDYSIKGLSSLNKDSKDAIMSALSELQDFGYLKMTKLEPKDSPKGQFDCIYDIYEYPMRKNRFGKTDSENPTLLNINNKVFKNKILNNTKAHSEKKEYMPYVHMQEKEYQTLIDKYGEKFTQRCIEVLNNYKGACGKKYKSDYLAILNWVVGRVDQEGIKKEPKAIVKTDKDIEEEIKRLEEMNNNLYMN